MTDESIRAERDPLGEQTVTAAACYGAQTARALENFAISGVPICVYPELIRGRAMVKRAAARANFECCDIDEPVLLAIEAACAEVIDGRLHDQFRIDVLQG